MLPPCADAVGHVHSNKRNIWSMSLSGEIGYLSGMIGHLSGGIRYLSGGIRYLSGMIGHLSGMIGHLSGGSWVESITNRVWILTQTKVPFVERMP